MRLLVLLLTLVAVHPQEPADPTLEQIIDRMERAAAPARGSAFVAATPPGNMFEFSLQKAEITVAKDGTVRIQEPSSEELKSPRLWSRTQTMVLTDDAVFVTSDELATLPSIPRRNGLGKTTQRILKSECDRVDPFREKWGASASHSWHWHIYFFALSPAKAFAFERNLRFKGRRKIEGREYFLLQSDRPLDYDLTYDSGGRKVAYGYVAQRRRFFVGVSDFRLRRLDDILWRPEYVNPPVTSVIESYEEGLPNRALIAIGNNMASWKVRPTVAESVRRGQEIAGASLIPDGSDLYATKVRHKDLAARLEKSPDDPDLLFSWAIHESNAKLSQTPDPKPFIEALEKIVANRWAETPVRNLVVHLTAIEDRDKLAPLLDRIEKDASMTRRAGPEVVRARIRLGDFDKAAAILDGLTELAAAGLWSARTELLLSKRDLAGAVSEFKKWLPQAQQPGSYGLSYGAFEFERVVKTIQNQIAELTTESVIGALDAALAEDPRNPKLHLTRLTMLRRIADPVRTANAVREALSACDERWINWQAAASISVMMRPDAEVKVEPEKLQGALEAILKALEPGKGRPCISAARGNALLKLGRTEEALQEFRNELDALEKAGPEFATNAMSVTETVKNLKEDALLERACRVHLGAFRQGKEQWRGGGEWAYATNPLATLIKVCGGARRWSDIYSAMRGMDLPRGFHCFWDPPVSLPVNELGEGLQAAALEDKDPAGIRWFAMNVVRSEAMGVASMLGLDSIEWLERAREANPQDLEVLQAQAEACAKKGDADTALDTVGRIRAAHKGGAVLDAAWSPIELALFAAEQHVRKGNLAAAKAEITAVDWSREDYPAWVGWLAADVMEAVGEFDRAVVAINRCEEIGHKPAYRLSLHYVKRGDWFEAMRYANRTIGTPYTPYLTKPGGRLDVELLRKFSKEKEEIPKRLREEIRTKAGERFFVDRLLASKLPAMTSEEIQRAKSALARLASDEITERSGAMTELRAIGPKAAPILKAALDSDEIEVSGRAKAIFQEWAEPR
jgi:tetratricopeptide (TPR) repeat protein